MWRSAISRRADSVPTPLERASFLAATRRFDDALSLWLTTLAQPASDEQQATDAINGLRQAIAVSVAVKDDPLATLQLIDAQSKDVGVETLYSPEWRSAWRAEAAALGERGRGRDGSEREARGREGECVSIHSRSSSDAEECGAGARARISTFYGRTGRSRPARA